MKNVAAVSMGFFLLLVALMGLSAPSQAGYIAPQSVTLSGSGDTGSLTVSTTTSRLFEVHVSATGDSVHVAPDTTTATADAPVLDDGDYQVYEISNRASVDFTFLGDGGGTVVVRVVGRHD